MKPDEYKTIASSAKGLYKDKGSKFIALAYPVDSVAEAMGILENVRKEFHDARHHCFAYRIGAEELNWRVNDDGEPSGTAGKPILGQIRSFGVTNIIIVVVRYFGGTLLGVGGLVNAYKNAANTALSSARIVKRTVNIRFSLVFPYSEIGRVMKLIKDENIDLSEQSFEIECRLIITLRKSLEGRIIKKLRNIDNLSFKLLEENQESKYFIN
ncbi:MAG TPA: YigZ family protein [Bacteroidales bacterium]|nr:YigZ family protein [Bacteroidales bacterium]